MIFHWAWMPLINPVFDYDRLFISSSTTYIALPMSNLVCTITVLNSILIKTRIFSWTMTHCMNSAINIVISLGVCSCQPCFLSQKLKWKLMWAMNRMDWFVMFRLLMDLLGRMIGKVYFLWRMPWFPLLIFHLFFGSCGELLDLFTFEVSKADSAFWFFLRKYQMNTFLCWFGLLAMFFELFFCSAHGNGLLWSFDNIMSLGMKHVDLSHQLLKIIVRNKRINELILCYNKLLCKLYGCTLR